MTTYEHIFDPALFLKAVNKILKPDGLLMFTCPNGAGFDTILLQFLSQAVDIEHV